MRRAAPARREIDPAAARWLAKARAGRTRTRKPPLPKVSRARLELVDGAAVFVCERVALSPNRSQWAHWRVKHKDRNGWEATIKTALNFWLDEAARTRAARRGLVAELVTGAPPPAPQAKYHVTLTRVCRHRSAFLTDDDNLTFCAKPILDSLKACGLIFDDARQWLDRPQPEQVLIGSAEACGLTVPGTIIRVHPFWRAPQGAIDV